MRLFVGLAITDEIRANVTSYVGNLQKQVEKGALDNDVKWVRPDSLHVTLKFIGENQGRAEIEKELSAIRRGSITLDFSGVGFFTPRSPRVFWAGVNAGPELERLATEVDTRLQRVGVPKEPHTYEEYQPHLTLARVGSGRPQGSPRDRNKPTMWAMKSLKEFVAVQPAPRFGTMTAEEFILFQSQTLPEGARYTPLARYRLSSS